MTKPSHLWPSLTDDEWMGVENSLKHMISLEYAERYNVSAPAPTESEIQDYILGVVTPAMRKKRQRDEETGAGWSKLRSGMEKHEQDLENLRERIAHRVFI